MTAGPRGRRCGTVVAAATGGVWVGAIGVVPGARTSSGCRQPATNTAATIAGALALVDRMCIAADACRSRAEPATRSATRESTGVGAWSGTRRRAPGPRRRSRSRSRPAALGDEARAVRGEQHVGRRSCRRPGTSRRRSTPSPAPPLQRATAVPCAAPRRAARAGAVGVRAAGTRTRRRRSGRRGRSRGRRATSAAAICAKQPSPAWWPRRVVDVA